jgi:hypothetical protein
LDELELPQLFEGFRGQRPWDRQGLAEILQRVSNLAAGAADWLGSLDINPMILGPDGFVAVDCLCILKER